MKKYFYTVTLFISLATFLPLVATAAPSTGTNIGGVFTSDQVWTLDHSPYHLTEDVIISGGHTLTIEPGVVIDLSPKASFPNSIDIEAGGTLIAMGTPQSHIVFRPGLMRINLSAATGTFEYADILGPQPYVLKGHIILSSSTVSIANSNGIILWDGIADINNSHIDGNSTGILIYKDFDGLHSSVNIDNSSISGNTDRSIFNQSSYAVNATHDWWGSADGPNASGANRIDGLATYTPWLTTPIDTSTSTSACCSSVLFLPGLEASWMDRAEQTLLLGTTTNTLWAPNRNDDVRKLFMNPDGTSKDPSIYSGGPIGSVWGLYSIYGKFMSFLDGLVSKGSIGEWYGYGYDWRKPIADVVTGPERKATTTESLVQTVQDMASRSKTGKVTLIAHSNGGLVAKYLVKTLADMGKSDLIDTVISVAVPYLGTPQAITALLYGDTEELAHGLIMKKSVAQELGSNMPSAYSLLPSAKFGQTAFNPISGSSSVTYPNQSLLASAGSLHGILDSFSWPSAIKRWAIVGWNEITAKIISFADKQHTTTQSNIGDGTVIAQSASYDAGTTTSIDLKNSGAKGIAHANILEAPSTEQVIGNIITDKDGSGANMQSISGVTMGPPDASREETYLVFSTHSPVDLHVYDQKGNHVGFVPRPAGIPAEVDDDLYSFYENKIPNSSFETVETSNGNYDTYVYMPEGTETYHVSIQGMGVGPFDLDVSQEKIGADEKVIEKVSYADVPTTPLTTADLFLTTSQLGSSASSSLLVQAPTLSVDIDGDGVSDTEVKANTPTDPIVFLEMMKSVVLTLSASTAQTKGKDIFASTLRKIDHLEDMVRAGKISRLHDTASQFSSHLSHKIVKGMSDEDRLLIVNMINEFLTHLD